MDSSHGVNKLGCEYERMKKRKNSKRRRGKGTINPFQKLHKCSSCLKNIISALSDIASKILL